MHVFQEKNKELFTLFEKQSYRKGGKRGLVKREKADFSSTAALSKMQKYPGLCQTEGWRLEVHPGLPQG